MLKGGCYCGAVKYEIHGKLLLFANCHCPDCRKFSGSAFASVLVTEETGFKLVSGETHLVPFPSSPGKFRNFCKTCGCHVFSRAEHRPGMIFVRAGSLDDDPQIKPQCHIWTGSKAPWHKRGQFHKLILLPDGRFAQFPILQEASHFRALPARALSSRTGSCGREGPRGWLDPFRQFRWRI